MQRRVRGRTVPACAAPSAIDWTVLPTLLCLCLRPTSHKNTRTPHTARGKIEPRHGGRVPEAAASVERSKFLHGFEAALLSDFERATLPGRRRCVPCDLPRSALARISHDGYSGTAGRKFSSLRVGIFR